MSINTVVIPPFIDSKNIYSISQLNNDINQKLQSEFGTVYVEAEVSNLVKPASGHFYFTLKDDKSQIKCALFKGYRKFIKTKIENGQKILVKAKISIYVPRGDYQLIIEHAYPTGLGALQQAYEQLKNKLQSEDLFNKTHKKAIPKLPKQIYVITSQTGAAIKDILITLNRRFPSIPVKIIPTLVQGETAAASITKALMFADKISNSQSDVIILSRGGGSLEDLWAFNDENLAREIFKAKTPIITGIGHEIDFTIADFVSDLRAATPTAAAEAATPNWHDYFNIIINLQNTMFNLYNNYLINSHQNLKHLNHRLLQHHPETKIQNQSQLIDDLYIKLTYVWENNYNKLFNSLKILNHKLNSYNPINNIKINQNNINYYYKILNNNISEILNSKKNHLQNNIIKLNSVNPLEVLSRGYSVILDKNNQVIINQNQVKSGDNITARLYKGVIDCKVL